MPQVGEIYNWWKDFWSLLERKHNVPRLGNLVSAMSDQYIRKNSFYHSCFQVLFAPQIAGCLPD